MGLGNTPMILTHICQSEIYVAISPLIRKAFDFLKKPETATLSRGRYEIDGERVYALVQKNSGRHRDEIKLESHRKYIDIHFALSDLESLAWKERFECSQIAKVC